MSITHKSSHSTYSGLEITSVFYFYYFKINLFGEQGALNNFLVIYIFATQFPFNPFVVRTTMLM